MITSTAMAALEKESEAQGITKRSLMENAGAGIYKVLKDRFSLKDKRILVVCYHGNNGGDGLVAARYLAKECAVDVLFLGDEEKFKPDAREYFEKIIDKPGIFVVNDYAEMDFGQYDIIIDAIFGTGIKGALSSQLIEVIHLINSTDAFKVSIDIPSGMDPDTGKVNGVAVEPNLIICMHDLKKGLAALKEKTVIVDIGIPKEIYTKMA